jgi:hypothetical protein
LEDPLYHEEEENVKAKIKQLLVSGHLTDPNVNPQYGKEMKTTSYPSTITVK